jgi:hypothetical protein
VTGSRRLARYLSELGLAIVYLPPPLRPDVLTPLAEALAEVD